MDTNYLISVIQQNTETIKQLNERIILLEEENKQQRERICSLEQGFNQLNERDKLVKDTIVEFKENVTNIRNNLDDVMDGLINKNYTQRMTMTQAHNPNFVKQNAESSISFAEINKYKNIQNYEITIGITQQGMQKEIVNNTRQQLFNELKQHAPYNTITSLTICDELYFKQYKRTGDECHDYIKEIVRSYCYKFDINFLTYFPNLETLIVKGYGLYGLLDCLTTTKHKLVEISLKDYYLAIKNDKEITGIEEYCKMNKIKFSLTYSREDFIYRIIQCSKCVGITHLDNMLCVELFA